MKGGEGHLDVGQERDAEVDGGTTDHVSVGDRPLLVRALRHVDHHVDLAATDHLERLRGARWKVGGVRRVRWCCDS